MTNNKQKRARFRQLAQQAGVQLGTEWTAEHEQPYLDLVAKDGLGPLLINDVLFDPEKLDKRAEELDRAAEEIGFDRMISLANQAAAFRRIRQSLAAPSDGHDSGRGLKRRQN